MNKNFTLFYTNSDQYRLALFPGASLPCASGPSHTDLTTWLTGHLLSFISNNFLSINAGLWQTAFTSLRIILLTHHARDFVSPLKQPQDTADENDLKSQIQLRDDRIQQLIKKITTVTPFIQCSSLPPSSRPGSLGLARQVPPHTSRRMRQGAQPPKPLLTWV